MQTTATKISTVGGIERRVIGVIVNVIFYANGHNDEEIVERERASKSKS